MSNVPRWPAVGGDTRRSERMSDRRPRAHVQVNYILTRYTSILGAHAAQVVGPGTLAVGELIGAVCKGRSQDISFYSEQTETPLQVQTAIFIWANRKNWRHKSAVR